MIHVMNIADYCSSASGVVGTNWWEAFSQRMSAHGDIHENPSEGKKHVSLIHCIIFPKLNTQDAENLENPWFPVPDNDRPGGFSTS